MKKRRWRYILNESAPVVGIAYFQVYRWFFNSFPVNRKESFNSLSHAAERSVVILTRPFVIHAVLRRSQRICSARLRDIAPRPHSYLVDVEAVVNRLLHCVRFGRPGIFYLSCFEISDEYLDFSWMIFFTWGKIGSARQVVNHLIARKTVFNVHHMKARHCTC